MGKLYLGGTLVRKIKLGISDIKIFCGDERVYPGCTATTSYTVSDAVANTVECNATANTVSWSYTCTTVSELCVTSTTTGSTSSAVTFSANVTNNEKTISGNISWNDTTVPYSFMQKGVAAYTAPTAKSGLVYNGSSQALVNAGSTSDGTIQYSSDNSNWSAAIPSGTNATAYTVYWRLIGNSTHSDKPSASINVTIGKVTPTVISPTAKVLTYNGNSQALVNAGSTDFGTLQYKLDSGSWGTSIPSAINGGSYVVSYRVVGNSNINDVASDTVNCSINEKPVTATVTLSPTAYTYNGSACHPTPTVKDSTTVIDPSEYSVTYSNDTNAGTGTCTISDNVGGNYNVIGSATFVINKANGSVTTAPTAKSLTYNGSAQALVNAGSGTGTMMYKLDSGAWGTSIPSGTNATSYTVYYKAAESTNYTESASGSVICSIAKAAMTYTAPSAATRTYNGSAQQIVSGASANGGSIYYATSSAGASSSTTVPTQTNASTTYSTYWKAVPDSNHSGGTSTWAQITGCKINQASLIITAKAQTVNYGTAITTGTAQVTISGLVNGDSLTAITLTPSTSNVPGGTITPSAGATTKGISNYSVTYSTGTLTINKVAMTYTAPSATTYTYDGNSKQLLSGASASGGEIQYSTNNSNWSTVIPTGVNATSYTSYWKAVPDSNHSGGTNSVSISTTIAKANGSVTTAPTAKSLTYNGSAQALVNAGSGTGTMMYNLNGGSWSTSIPTGTGGTYTVGYKASASTNYNESASGSVNVTIALPYLTFVATESGTFKFSGNSISYSLDNSSTWTSLASNTNSPTVSAGSKIMWKATGLTPTANKGIGIFSSTGRFTVKGNIMSLYYGDDFVGQTSLSGKDYAFRNLFSGCTGITSTENLSLPATNLGGVWHCYSYMFYGCTSLTTAPELPATTLADSCYRQMFYGCTNLTTAPELPATTLAYDGYRQMFQGCTSLTTAPELPATTLAAYCYQDMFNGCTSLTTAPSTLPATALTTFCYYQMFQGCTSLTTAPSTLPATNLSGADNCYYSMFQGCTSLTTAPELPATTLAQGCYSNMFYNCTSLTTAPELPATNLSGANSCYSNMFYGCTGLTTAPELPATTLTRACYSSMFEDCTSLTTAPELPATTLANYCYYYMFRGCTSLNYIKCLATNISASNCTSNWVTNVASSGTFVKSANMASWTIGVNGIPTNWTVQDASS